MLRHCGRRKPIPWSRYGTNSLPELGDCRADGVSPGSWRRFAAVESVIGRSSGHALPRLIPAFWPLFANAFYSLCRVTPKALEVWLHGQGADYTDKRGPRRSAHLIPHDEPLRTRLDPLDGKSALSGPALKRHGVQYRTCATDCCLRPTMRREDDARQSSRITSSGIPHVSGRVDGRS